MTNRQQFEELEGKECDEVRGGRAPEPVRSADFNLDPVGVTASMLWWEGSFEEEGVINSTVDGQSQAERSSEKPTGFESKGSFIWGHTR